MVNLGEAATETLGAENFNSNTAASELVISNIDHNHPLFLHQNDTPGSSLISLQLVGLENYAIWSRSMRIGLIGKSKLGFIDVRPGLLGTVVYGGDAHKVWCDLKKRFDKINGAHDLSQETMSVSDYYTKLKGLWNDYDSIMPCPGCSCPESKKFQDHYEYQRLLEFLMGLNETYSAVRGQILMQSPTPNLNKAFFLVMDHKSQRNIAHTNYESCLPKLMESTALFSQKGSGHSVGNGNFGHQPGGGGGHTKEQCFKVKGYPVGWRSKKKTGSSTPSSSSFANQVTVAQSAGLSHNEEPSAAYKSPSAFFTKDQYQQIMQLLTKGSDTGGDHSAKIAITGRVLSTLVSKYVNKEWIVDTGATNYMISQLSSLDKCTSVSKPERRQDLYSGQVKGISRQDEGLYILKEGFNHIDPTQRLCSTSTAQASSTSAVYGSSCSDSSTLWHSRLGHAPIDVIRRSSSLAGVDISDISTCTVCPLAKQTKVLFPISNHTSKALFDLVHCDVWGPYRVPTHNGMKYFVTVVHDYSRFTWLFLLTAKSDTIVVMRHFFAQVHNLFSTCVKVLRTDNKTKFMSTAFQSMLSTLGLYHQTTCVYTPQQNGVVERKHRTILNMTRALRFQASVPLQFWGECVTTAVYILNRLSSKLLSYKSLFELLYQHSPSLSHIKTFGCLCYATCPAITDKFSPRAIPVVLMGYSLSQKGYLLYDLHTKSLFVNKHVVFKEDMFPFRDFQTSSNPIFPILTQVQPDNDHPPTSLSPVVTPQDPQLPPTPEDHSPLPSPTAVPTKKSSRSTKLPIWLQDFVTQSKSHSCLFPVSDFVSYKHVTTQPCRS
ncbi:uncharacterized protein LOC129900086 [Solanum dulcamara]|uniref:uncharacterized protein LOC129900086 n=1 Tax=Solanum dulcamara TaxID=45834 RepID=UPI00248690ED|nr:uncharacterized protein LOC129900086 [Solanum dulcamara]